MAGPSEKLKQQAEEIERTRRSARDKLLAHVILLLSQDLAENEGKRNKEYLRDEYIVPRMQRLRESLVMVTEEEGVRLDRYLQLSRNEAEMKKQVKKLESLLKSLRSEEVPDPVLEEQVTVYSLNPEFREWAKKRPNVYKKLMKIVGQRRLCPIRSEKEHRGEVNVQRCER